MLFVFSLFRNTAFLLITCATLAVSTAGLAVKTLSLSAQVATLSASAAGSALAQRKAVAKAVARSKSKARLRRVMVGVPLLGLAAAAAFERQDYLDWQQDNPGGTLGDYGCDVARSSAEVMDDVLQELPERVRPSPEMVMSLLPDCDPL
ncbi:hypothetical protein [Marinovum sp.]|uniref:hypothetical protein n=1 Tax=Marinovum sp. TaxID=2024839 RepID=UPI002B274FEF|nr:hypothetical protein [Marinovum sp.]